MKYISFPFLILCLACSSIMLASMAYAGQSSQTQLRKRLNVEFLPSTSITHPTKTPQRSPQWTSLSKRLRADGFAAKPLAKLFTRVQYSPDAMGKKMRALYKRKYKIITKKPKKAAVSSKTKRKKTYLYEPHLTPDMLARLRVFRKQHKKTLLRAEKQYHVPQNIILAFLVVETKLGTFLGTQMAFTTLASMAATRDYNDISSLFTNYAPTATRVAWINKRMVSKRNWAYKELKALLTYAACNKLDPTRMPSSIYGAIGMCQFMPTNVLKFALDGNNDAVKNIFNPDDAIISIASFVRKAGWKNSLSRKRKIQVIRRYNPDTFYARTILSVAAHM